MSSVPSTSDELAFDYDVAIIGGGPAGLSAAVVLGRARRRVVLFDHGRPRNYAAGEIHGYLGREGVSPSELRQCGREDAAKVGVELLDAEVTRVQAIQCEADSPSRFEVHVAVRSPLRVRKILLATGLRDVLPEIQNIESFYGTTVHHCPYCDGWEHRGKRLAAFGDGDAAAALAMVLRAWSAQVVACSNGQAISAKHLRLLERNQIRHRAERVVELAGTEGDLEAVVFEDGPPLPCDALFFKSEKHQRSPLAAMLGCAVDDDHVELAGKQGTGVPGVFLAGDAAGHVQFAIVAAAEGAIAATAINRELQDEDCGSVK
jgi:thioredoxin reductase